MKKNQESTNGKHVSKKQLRAQARQAALKRSLEEEQTTKSAAMAAANNSVADQSAEAALQKPSTDSSPGMSSCDSSRAGLGKKTLRHLAEYFQVVHTHLGPSHETVEQICPTDQQLAKARRALRNIVKGHPAERVGQRYSRFTQYSLDELLNHPEVYRFYYTTRSGNKPVFQIVSIEYRIVLRESLREVVTFIDHQNGAFHGLTMQKFADWESARKKAEKAEAPIKAVKAAKAVANAVNATKTAKRTAVTARIEAGKAAAEAQVKAETAAAMRGCRKGKNANAS